MSGVVMVTGSGRRIGRAIALGFARRGWSVAIHYGSSADGAEQTRREIESIGGRAFVVQADVRKRDEIRAAVFAARDHFGRLDVLINNAGIYPPATPIEKVTEEMWRSVIETNLFGEFFAAQAAAEVMKAQAAQDGARDGAGDGERGRIINFSSLGAFQIWKNRIPYNVSKAGVVQMTRALARALAPDITVNSVAPGTIEIPEEPAPGGLIPPERIPMARYGTVDDIFRAIWFFAVDATYVTGQTLIVDGGLNIAQETSQE